MKTSIPTFRFVRSAFSLVEMLAVITIIGIVVFLAIPNLVRIRGDAEESHADARIEALNMAMAAYMNSDTPTTVSNAWHDAGDDAGRYGLVKSYLAFAPTNLADYEPDGYTFTFPPDIMTLEPVKRGTN